MPNKVKPPFQIVVQLQSANMNSDNVYVSSKATLTLETFKKTNSNPLLWAPNMCFELQIKSPYKNPADYSPFKSSMPPVCNPVTVGTSVSCSLKPGTNDTLQYSWTSISSSTQSYASLSFNITNFFTPFSSQTFPSITLKVYSDASCSVPDAKNPVVKIQSIQIKAQNIPQQGVKLATSNTVIAYTGPDSTLSFSFQPRASFAPGGTGVMKIYMPYWYSIGVTNVMPYNPKAFNQCSSPCFTLSASSLSGQFVEVDYTAMTAQCIEGSQNALANNFWIQINCTGFWNPIYQDLWDNFYVEVYDAEPVSRLIQASFPAQLDATKFTPATLSPSTLQVQPTDSTVNTQSSWTLSFQPTVPLGNECYIKLFFPVALSYEFAYVQADGIFLPQNLQSILSTSDIAISPPTKTEPRQSAIFYGCNQDSSLGISPFGSAIISSITTQKAQFDSDSFGLTIYKDEDCTMLIAILQDGVKIYGSQLSTGILESVSIYPLVSTVQVSSQIYINFVTQHTLYPGASVVITMPAGLTLPPNGTIIQVTPIAGSTRATTGVVNGTTIVIKNFVQDLANPAPFSYQFALSNIANQLSAKDAGSWGIQTFYLNYDQANYLVDSVQMPSSYKATTGLLSADKSLSIDNPLNFADNAAYLFSFSEDSVVPKGGYLKIDFPQNLVFNPNVTLTTKTCATTTCTLFKNSSIIVKTLEQTNKSQSVQVTLGGIKNPRSFVPSQSFTITSFDTDGASLIDIGYNQNVATSIAGNITTFTVRSSSEVNGVINTYSFGLTTTIPMVAGDVLKFSFPADIVVNARGQQSVCLPLNPQDQIVCSISGTDIQITLNTISTPFAFSWQMTNVGNPGSVRPSGGFTQILFQTSDKYLISTYPQASAPGITNSIPANLTTFNLFQDSLQNSVLNNYTFTFTPINALPATGSIKLKYPNQINLADGVNTKCFVTTNKLFSNNCVIDPLARTVVITGVFASAAPYSSAITIMLQNVQNPPDNRRFPHDGFDLSTYSDAAQLYVADIAVDKMTPILSCDYPCASCSDGDRLSCTACWQSPDINLNFLMSYVGQRGQCKTKCDYNFTSNGSPTHICTPCDVSCDGCADNGKVNDTRQCTTCSMTYPYRLANTNTCLNTCKQGIFQQTLFQQSEFVCDTCTAPCLGCYGSKTNCTSCDQQSNLTNLYQSQCIKDCPDGTTSVAGVCQPCASPCKTCAGSPSICTMCDGSQERSFILNSTCYSDCPTQYANNPQTNTCVGCLTGCNKCNVTNTSQCLTCGVNLFLFNSSCVGSCPSGYTGKSGLCYITSDDLKVLYFPFLISAFILTCMVFFGKLKKKAVLVNGKKQFINNQQSIAVINSVVAPLQTLATIVQFVLAIYYQQTIHFILAIIVFGFIVLINASFLIWYLRQFYIKKKPIIGTTVIHNGRDILISSKEDQSKHLQPVDALFSNYTAKHKFACLTVLLSTGVLHFKTSKMFYSRFYMFDMFKAQWTHATYLKNSMTKWQVLQFCLVDIVLIGIGVFGLLFIQWNGVVNQLMITMIETIVLSIYLIVLAVIEKVHINKIFEYTEVFGTQKLSKEMDTFNKRGRMLQMNNLLAKVKNSSNAFNDKKLSDLLMLFGGRKCRSMQDLGTGWPEEDDPRHLKTWPVSRAVWESMEQQGFKKFTPEDAFGLQDNCYAEGVHRHKGKDKNIQGDAANLEFQNALNRKHGDLMAKLDEQDEMHTRKDKRRRGRKNKYYNQIDLEDDQELDPDEASGKEDLQIIKEQEEEEERLRQVVQEQTKKQLEASQARAGRVNQDRLTREQLMEQKERELKMKQELAEQALKKQEMMDLLRLKMEEEQRRQLEEEAASILKQREEQERAELLKQQQVSEANRLKYEQEERERLAQLEEQKRLRLLEEEQLLQQDLARQKQEKEALLARMQQEQEERDKRQLLENQMLLEQQEKERQEEKEREALRKEQQRKERQAAEEAEKLAKQIAQEREFAQQQQDKDKRHKQQEKEQEDKRIKDELDKKEREEKAKAEKAERHQREQLEKEKEKQAKEEQRLALIQKQKDDEQEQKDKAALALKLKQEKQAQDQAEKDAKAKKELPKAAESVVKQESAKVQSAVQDAPSSPPIQQSKQTKIASAAAPEMESEIDVMSSIVDVNSNVMQDFKNKQNSTIPPDANLRTFNENEILGELDRDEKGNVVVLEDKNGRKHDKKRNPVNARGYLVDPKSGDVIENQTHQPMFAQKDMDERGEVPAPFCIEKYNFNPHNLLGDFDYQDGKPILMKTAQGFFIDKKARRVNQHGWFTIPNQGHIVDKEGRKKFDKKQLVHEDLHKLFNYQGKRFDIKDVMGQLQKDQYGNIQPQLRGKDLLDNLGRLVNDKGYLIDEAGNIIDINAKQIWKKTDLKNGEFPKIFPFTKFNIARIQADLEGNKDKQGRATNKAGYLVDKHGNIIDFRGKLMFDKCVLDDDGEIPQVFRTGQLRSDTASSLSRLMSEIERNQSEYGRPAEPGNDSAYEKQKQNDGDTSVDSKMEDTPANYNIPNQRYDSDGNQEAIPEDEEGGEHMAPSDFSDQDDAANLIAKKKQKPKKKKKNKKKDTTIEFLEPTNREKNMAGAYGGVARGEIRRPGIKYDKERLKDSKKFRVSTADEPRVRAQLTQLAMTGGFQESKYGVDGALRTVTKEHSRPEPKRQGLMKASDGLSSNSAKDRKIATVSKKRGINDADFEQMFGKDIDQFLEDSEWDIESQDKASQGSKNSQLVNAKKLKKMEKVYLKRIEGNGSNLNLRAPSGLDVQKKRQKREAVMGPDRETIMNVTDNPQVIHRGNLLPFNTQKTLKK